MSDAARLARQSFASKPDGVAYGNFSPSSGALASIAGVVGDAALESSYAAVVSYAEAITGLLHGSISWSIVRLYYSSFYCVRGLLLLKGVIPFNCGGEMLLDTHVGHYLKGGRSSHHWNWTSIEKIPQLKGNWFVSEDSQEAYKLLREYRENVNYTHYFTDPTMHECLVSEETDLMKRFRRYRDDGTFLYTYLSDHLAIAYPTKLIFQLETSLKSASLGLHRDQISHMKKIWPLKDRCPVS